MDIILHIGAQRTATTTLQSYLRANAAALSEQEIGFWGPIRTRNDGLLSGVLPETRVPDTGPLGGADRARRRIAARLETTARRGIGRLIVSDENMLGTVRQNLRGPLLYPDAGARLQAYARAFDGAVGRVVLSVRALDQYWSSAWAYAVGRGFRLPRPSELEDMADQPRSWQAVIEEAAAAFPGAEIQVHVHERHAGFPERRLWHMLDGKVEPPMRAARGWLHRAPDLGELRAVLAARGEDPGQLPPGAGRWAVFDAPQAARLRETYADDMFWLEAGAGGKATLIEEEQPDQAGANLPGGATTRGQKDDRQDGKVARAG
ncbi:MAG: hypothetical protein R3D85_04225 [Paracoccaceae bacterium]